jgi:hypothetical protein
VRGNSFTRHQVERPGHGDNPDDRDNEQPSPTGSSMPMGAVHRLNGGGSWDGLPGLKI